MRILYYSDIHIEFRLGETRLPWTDAYPLDLGPCLDGVGDVDLVVLAGDIGPARPVRGVSVLGYAGQVAERLNCPVVLVPGNHEYYGTVFEDARADLLAARIPSVHVLDRGEAVFDIRGEKLRVLGATLWTDYEIAGDLREAMHTAVRGLRDHACIMRVNGQRWMPADALLEHHRSRDWLLAELAKPHDGPTLIVTHHVPHRAGRNPHYPMDNAEACFTSDRTDVIEAAASAGVAAWIFGHNHFSTAVEVAGLPLLTAQWGYAHEGAHRTNWRGPGLLKLPSPAPVARAGGTTFLAAE